MAQAIWGMGKCLTPDRMRAGIALAALAIVVFASGSLGQIGAIIFGAVFGLWLCRANGSAQTMPHLHFPVSSRQGAGALGVFAVLLVIPPFVVSAGGGPALALFDAFYRSGALVFGGGHVVLPLLQAEAVAPGWVTNESFLSGYGIAQAVPGPLFTFAAYLAPTAFSGALIALVAIFLPGVLLVYGMLPFWSRLRSLPAAQAAMRGANAAVVGILGATLYSPVWTNAVLSPHDFLLALTGFLLLTVWNLPPWLVVALLATAGTVVGLA